MYETKSKDCGGGLVAQSCPALVTPWTIALQAPLSIGFSRQEYWSGFPFPSPIPRFTFVQLIKIIWVKIHPSVEKNETNTKSGQLTR